MCDEKICNFYANEVHLGVTIVPFVANKLKDNNKICTILNVDINKEVEKILSKINIDNKLKNEILNLNWNKTRLKGEKLKEYIDKGLEDNSELYVIVNGTKKEVEEKNKYIEEIRKENKDKKINIVNCFKINEEKINDGLLNNYHKILNTSGCKYIN